MRKLALAFLLFVAAWASAAEPVAITLDSKVLGEQRRILVRVPASYAGGARAYPVVYLTDGDRQIQHLAAVSDFLVREGRMPEVIFVGIVNTDRTRDLTPTHVETFGGNFRVPTSGGADRFLDFISTELMPHIEKNYRTQPYRVFAGHSFGGLFAMHAALTRPGLFHGVIAASPTLTWDNRYVHRRATEFLKANGNTQSALVFTVGNEGAELDREFDALESLLRAQAPKGLDWQAIRLADEDHGSVVLPTHYAGLRRVFAPFRFVLAGDQDPKTLYARARDHFAKTSTRVGFTVPVPEATTNVIGYRLLQAGHRAEAIEVFRKNAEAYPKSANVYDSLAEALEQAGDLAGARTNYEKAAAIGKENADPNAAIYQQNLDRVRAALAAGSK